MPIELRMPRLTDSMTQGTVLAWRKRQGDPVRAGEVIVEIEVDKAAVDVESPADGILTGILVSAGTEKVEVGRVLALIDEQVESRPPDGESSEPVPPATTAAAALSAHRPAKANGSPIGHASNVEGSPAPAPAASSVSDSSHLNAGPLVLSMARQAGLDLATLQGSGAEGRVLLEDLKKALGLRPETRVEPARGPAPSRRSQETAPYQEVPHSRVRQVIADRLSESKRSIPHFYLEVQCRVDALLKVRSELADRREGGVKLSINDFAVRAAALALRAVPEANATWTEGATRRFSRVDLAVAVATDAGLMAPVLRDADRKGLLELSSDLRDLAQRAREGRLRPDELQGGTFTISNLGMYGAEVIYPIINPPQAGILGLGAAAQRPVAQDGAVIVATVMTCTLSADHRVLDGVAGARFLATFKDLIEQPITMLL